MAPSDLLYKSCISCCYKSKPLINSIISTLPDFEFQASTWFSYLSRLHSQIRFYCCTKLNFLDLSIQELTQREKVYIDWEKGTQISILANKITTQWWPNNIIKEPKQNIHYIYFLFSRYYVHIMLLIWPKNWNCV